MNPINDIIIYLLLTRKNRLVFPAHEFNVERSEVGFGETVAARGLVNGRGPRRSRGRDLVSTNPTLDLVLQIIFRIS